MQNELSNQTIQNQDLIEDIQKAYLPFKPIDKPQGLQLNKTKKMQNYVIELIKKNDIEKIETLSHEMDIKSLQVDKRKTDFFIMAVSKKNIPLVKKFIELGFDIAGTENEKTALDIACQQDNLEMFKLLLENDFSAKFEQKYNKKHDYLENTIVHFMKKPYKILEYCLNEKSIKLKQSFVLSNFLTLSLMFSNLLEEPVKIKLLKDLESNISKNIGFGSLNKVWDLVLEQGQHQKISTNKNMLLYLLQDSLSERNGDLESIINYKSTRTKAGKSNIVFDGFCRYQPKNLNFYLSISSVNQSFKNWMSRNLNLFSEVYINEKLLLDHNRIYKLGLETCVDTKGNNYIHYQINKKLGNSVQNLESSLIFKKLPEMFLIKNNEGLSPIDLFKKDVLKIGGSDQKKLLIDIENFEVQLENILLKNNTKKTKKVSRKIL